MRPTLFEFAGGTPAFLRAGSGASRPLRRGPRAQHPFSHPGRHPQHVERLAAYWADVMGGPPSYSQSCGDQTGVLQMHAGNGDMGDLAERFLRCFDLAADDAGLPADPDARAALHDYMRWAVDVVSAYSPTDTVVAAGAAMPRSGWDGLEQPAG